MREEILLEIIETKKSDKSDIDPLLLKIWVNALKEGNGKIPAKTQA